MYDGVHAWRLPFNAVAILDARLVTIRLIINKGDQTNIRLVTIRLIINIGDQDKEIFESPVEIDLEIARADQIRNMLVAMSLQRIEY